MRNISNTIGLKEAIRQLEYKQADQGKLVKEQFNLARESLKPASLIKSTFNEVAASPILISNILGATLGLSAGYFSKKLFIGSSANQLKKLFGNLLQLGIATVVAKKPEVIKSLGGHILLRIFRRKKPAPEA